MFNTSIGNAVPGQCIYAETKMITGRNDGRREFRRWVEAEVVRFRNITIAIVSIKGWDDSLDNSVEISTTTLSFPYGRDVNAIREVQKMLDDLVSKIKSESEERYDEIEVY